MYRVTVANTDADHPNAEPFTFRGATPDLDAAKGLASAAATEFPKRDGYRVTLEALDADGWKDAS